MNKIVVTGTIIIITIVQEAITRKGSVITDFQPDITGCGIIITVYYKALPGTKWP